MALIELLSQRKTIVLNQWRDRIIESYPEQTAKIFKRERNPFANPVGQTIFSATAEIIDLFLTGFERSALGPPLERIIQIRSIQDFSASAAIAFIFDLREIVRKELGGELEPGSAEWRELEGRFDKLMFLGFDIYVRCREQYFEVRMSELKRSVAAMARRAADPDQ